MDQKDTKEKKNIKKAVRKIQKYEKLFSARKYKGKGKKYIEIMHGKQPVSIIASQAVVCTAEEGEERTAGRFSGGLTKLLAQDAGCGAVYMTKTCPEQALPEIIKEIADFLDCSQTEVFLDFQMSDSEEDNVIQLFTEIDERNAKYAFIRKMIIYSFEYEYREMDQAGIVGDATDRKCGIAAKAAKESNAAYVCIKLNRNYCDPSHLSEFARLYRTLSKIVCMLSSLDWKAERIEAFRLGQSAVHKPQDKVELPVFGDGTTAFSCNGILNVCAYGAEPQMVRLHEPEGKTVNNLKNNAPKPEGLCVNEYIFLTNRLIGMLFGRKWIEGREESPGLMGAPVILYENAVEKYPIGLPKANQIDGVFFSTELYNAKKKEAEDFNFVIFNRYTDSRLYIDFRKADYGDFGGVKDANGSPAQKVMIPRYYKKLLDFLDQPLPMIRSEEYRRVLADLGAKHLKDFDFCYEEIKGESFYSLKKELDWEKKEVRKHMNGVIEVQQHWFDEVELLRVPKEVKPKQIPRRWVWHKLSRMKMNILKKYIGKAEYLLKTEWTSETDDRNNIARMNSNMMSLLGVLENDKIIVKFGKTHEILRVHTNDELTDYQIGIPAPARKRLGMNSINDIVVVHRDMVHIFLRHSEEQTIAILGTVLAVYQVFTQAWLGVILCLLLVPLIMYFVLNEERIKVK